MIRHCFFFTSAKIVSASLVMVLMLVAFVSGFTTTTPTTGPYSTMTTTTCPSRQNYAAIIPRSSSTSALQMGLFDGIAKAFSNEDFKSQDQRVRASHILIKGDDIEAVFDTITKIFSDINTRVNDNNEELSRVFAEIARAKSDCSSASQGGDLGIFGKGTMVSEFDDVLFPDDPTTVPPPPVGSLVGPVITEFGAHIIYVTKREQNTDQVEEKLARIDKDAQQ